MLKKQEREEDYDFIAKIHISFKIKKNMAGSGKNACVLGSREKKMYFREITIMQNMEYFANDLYDSQDLSLWKDLKTLGRSEEDGHQSLDIYAKNDHSFLSLSFV